MISKTQPWLQIRIEDAGAEGVEAPKLSRFLEDLSSAFYAIARAKVGSAPSRPGPRRADEESIAGIRILRIIPGSATIELAPPANAEQSRLPFGDEPTAEDVAFEFFQEAVSIENNEPPATGRAEIRRRVREVVTGAGEIGSTAEITYNPRSPRPEWASTTFSARVRTRDLVLATAAPRVERRKRLSGHAYMIDVEPGKRRLRLKLPEGRDLTIDVEDALAGRLSSVIDRVVEIDVEEETEGEVVTRRVARGLELLPSAGVGSDHPPKSAEELAREQSLPDTPPDYVTMASQIWTSRKEVAEFEEHIRGIRQAATS